MRDAAGLILVGVRISLALSFVVVFSVEAINAREGLGFMVIDGWQNLQYDRMYAAITALAALGFLADRALGLLAARFTRGQRVTAVGRA